MKPYYYVQFASDLENEPRHESLAGAREAAEMLAAENPGDSVEILKCVGIASCTKASTFWMDGEEPKDDPPAIQFFTNSARDVFWMREKYTKMVFREWIGEWQHSETPTRYLMAPLQPIDESELPEDARQKLKEIEQ